MLTITCFIKGAMSSFSINYIDDFSVDEIEINWKFIRLNYTKNY